MRLSALVTALVAVLAASGAPAAQQSKGGIELAPHRAVYEFNLSSTRSASSISALSGRMVYEFQGSKCDGFTQSMRFVTLSTAQSGETTLADQRSITWEDPSGNRLRFQTKQYRDRKLVEEAAGSAKRPKDGGDIEVEITLPKDERTGIGAGAMFPIQHSVKLLEAARSGAKSFRSDFYDGSEGGGKSYHVAAFLGGRKAPGYNKSLPRMANIAVLDKVAAWPVSLSYFEHGSERKDTAPVYEISFMFFENGVSRSLMIDNGDYAIKGKLTKLEMLDPMPCRE